MIFIVEGPDLSGKTSLINRLIKEFPGVAMKITDRPFDSSEGEREKIIDHYWSTITYLQAEQFKNYVLDRFYPSEIVYSVMRGYDNFGNSEFELIEHAIKELNPVLIYCDPGSAELDRRFDVRGDDYVNKEENRLIHTRYERFFNETTLKKLKVDSSRPIEEMVDNIKNFLKK